MKKTLMALAVGAAFAAPAAFADVTISGSINMGPYYMSVGKTSSQAANVAASLTGLPATNYVRNSVSSFGVATNYSNVTISSTDDLGNGNKLDFAYQITAPAASAGANGNVQNRNSHIGVVNDSWGGVWWGSNENIYERYLYTIDPLDGAAGIGGNLQMLGTPGGQVFGTGNSGYSWYRRDEQSIWYDSPNWNGFTFGVVYQTNYAKDQCSAASTTTVAGTGSTAGIFTNPGTGTNFPGNSCNPSMWQLGGKYASPSIPLSVWAAYGDRKDQFGLSGLTANYSAALLGGSPGALTNGTSSTDTAGQVGVSYLLGDINIFGIYEQLNYKESGVTAGFNEWKRSAWSLGLKWNLATGYVGAQYISAADGKATCAAASANLCNAVGGGSNTGGHMIGVGYYHTLTKQSQAYVMGSWIDNKSLGLYGSAGGNNAGNLTNIGATNWAATVGLKHSF